MIFALLTLEYDKLLVFEKEKERGMREERKVFISKY